MTSTRTVSTELDGVSVGIYNYYSGAGANYVTVTGSEYDGFFFHQFQLQTISWHHRRASTGTLPRITWDKAAQMEMILREAFLMEP